MTPEYDLVIRGGTLADGTGAALREADIAITGGRIAAVGAVSGSGREEIEAKGQLVTPGFVDIHTHYDGQATWDQQLAPSSWHGVTTAVMGNCGVGFAPVRPQDHNRLIELMEGVEDIPGAALHEGLSWDWQSFPEYLDRLAERKFDIDICAQLPHGALRVADSSFNGAAQPTTSIYMGETLIGFGSPNPNPKLYDVASVEILEGPQGTLFGSGSMGGVIRIVPNPVNLHDVQGSALAGGSITAGGTASWKTAATFNLPVINGRLGMRLVAYNERQGGYINDPRLGSNINSVTVSGGRLALAADLGNGLTINLGGLSQSTRARDMQYADSTGPLQRTAAILEPYSSDLKLGHLDLRKTWDSGWALTSVLSVGHRSMRDRFDATSGRTRITAYDLQRSSSLLTSETRLGGAFGPAFNWVAGITFEHIEDGQTRALGIPDDPNALDEVTNKTTSGSMFAQGRVRILRQVQLTLGLRYTIAETDSQPARGGKTSFLKGKLSHRFDPTVAVLWQASPRLAFYGRFQTSYRNGGVSVTRGIGKIAEFGSDSIVMGEVGFRLGPRKRRGLSLSGAVSAARWKDVLAELISPRGVPVTSNIGDARILTAEANADWSNGHGLFLGASLLRTSNHLVGKLAMQSAARSQLLPDSPKFSATVRGRYTWTNSHRTTFEISANGQYVGRSVLGPGAFLDLDQGDYSAFDLGFRVSRGPLSLSMTVENAFNSHANRFALGNPLMLYRRDGQVPLRPRTIGVSAGINW